MLSPNLQVAASSSSIYGRGPRWGTNDFLCALPPSRPSPVLTGKETLPHAVTEFAGCSIFLPHLWGRTEVGDKRLPLRAAPIPAFPRFDGGRRRCRMLSPNSQVAASSSSIYGRGPRWGTNDFLCALPPSRPSPVLTGKETLPHAVTEFACCSIFLPIYGGGPRWGTNDLALKSRGGGQTTSSARCPHPGLPRFDGEGDAAACCHRIRMLQHLPPHL